ncbi:MAG: glycosyltransferase family 2 protein [Bacteroidaceae bacterium]|nr:glycosyltransferase family 2 protein [Bacteroidaceae bacterium]
MKPLVTIIIPVRNRASLITRTLDSVVASTYRPLWLLIVDNGSTDETKAVCDDWANRHRSSTLRVDVIEEPTAGAPAARNAGLRRVETRYVYFFDSDDCFSADFLEDVERILRENRENPAECECDLLFTPVRQGRNGSMRVRDHEKSDWAAVQMISSMLSTHSMVLRTEWLRQIGAWDERLSIWQDWELGVRVLLNRPHILWATGKSYHEILLHENSITGASLVDRWEGTLEAMRVALEDVRAAKDMTKRELRSCLRALYLRAMIQAGRLLREHCPEGAQAYVDYAKEVIAHPTKPLRMWGMVLRNYVARGGRGAWRVARQLV